MTESKRYLTVEFLLCIARAVEHNCDASQDTDDLTISLRAGIAEFPIASFAKDVDRRAGKAMGDPTGAADNVNVA